jgi:hypothetical protein
MRQRSASLHRLRDGVDIGGFRVDVQRCRIDPQALLNPGVLIDP